MTDPVDTTIQTYREHYTEYVAGTEQAFSPDFLRWIDSFLARLPLGGRILELGSAFGRGAQLFHDHGFDVWCTDVVPEALDSLSARGYRTAYYDFRDQPPVEWHSVFDAVFASAVFVHASGEHFAQALRNCVLCLKDNGLLAFSLKEGVGEELSDHKVGGPRYFNYFTETELREYLRAVPVEVVSIEHAHTPRKAPWLVSVVRKTGEVVGT